MEKDYNLAIKAVGNTSARGTIHPTAISRGFSLPLDPTDYKGEDIAGMIRDAKLLLETALSRLSTEGHLTAKVSKP